MKKTSLNKTPLRAMTPDQFEKEQLSELKKAPNNPAILYQLGIFYAEQGDFKTALRYLTQGHRVVPNDPSMMIQLANIQKILKQFAEAKVTLQTFIHSEPLFSAAYNNLGTIFHLEGDFIAAEAAFLKAIDLQSNYLDAYYNLGLARRKLKKNQQALIAFDAVLALNSAHIAAHFQLGTLYMEQKKWPLALTHLQAIEYAASHFPEIVGNLASVYLNLNQPLKAKHYHLKAIELAPQDAQCLFNLGVIYAQEGHYERAIHFYTKAISVTPQFFDAHHNLAILYWQLKNADEAVEHLKKAAHIQPDHPTIRYLLQILETNDSLSAPPPQYVRSLFDSYAPRFDHHLNNTLQYQVPYLFQLILKQFSANLPTFCKALDLGCGTGLCGEMVRPWVTSLSGVDLSANMLEKAAQKKCYSALHCADFIDYLSNDVSFDLILAGDAIVYLGQLDGFFQLIKKALKPNGLFLFNVEAGQKRAYQMTPSGRFAHQKAYIDDLLKLCQFRQLTYQNAPLRMENQHQLMGHVYLFQHATLG